MSPASDFNCSSAEVMHVDDSEDIPYIQNYLVAMSTKSWACQCPPKATHSPNNMSIWTLSRYWRRFLMVFLLGVLAVVAKKTIVDRRISKFTRLVFVAAVSCF